MAKGGKDARSKRKGSEGGKNKGGSAQADALRDAGRRAADLAQNPYARSLLAAGLVAAAAALASNRNVREATRRNVRAMTEVAEVGAENAGKIGLAIVNAATEAVQRMLKAGAAAAGEAVEKTGGAQKGGGPAAAAPKAPAAEAKPRKPRAPAKPGAAATKAGGKAKAAPKSGDKPKAAAARTGGGKKSGPSA